MKFSFRREIPNGNSREIRRRCELHRGLGGLAPASLRGAIQTPGDTTTMKFRDAKILLRASGMTLVHTGIPGEYRVNFIGGLEATAYYTNDLDDAVGTAGAMLAHAAAAHPKMEIPFLT